MPSYVGFQVWDMGFDAHLTVCYFGDNADEKTLQEIKDIISEPQYQGDAWASRKDPAFFGPLNDIPVLKVSVASVMYQLRERLQKYSVSQFTEWNPHITLDLDTINTVHLPKAIRLTHLGIY